MDSSNEVSLDFNQDIFQCWFPSSFRGQNNVKIKIIDELGGTSETNLVLNVLNNEPRYKL